VNWSRGLLRLWIAFTVFWVGAVGWFLYLDNPGYFSTPVQSTVSPTKGDWIVENPKQSTEVSFDDLIPGTPANEHRVFWKESVPAAVMWAVAVPAFFLCRWLDLAVDRTGLRITSESLDGSHPIDERLRLGRQIRPAGSGFLRASP
jgi:hypothetical protein